jgi:hypothetical protein
MSNTINALNSTSIMSGILSMTCSISTLVVDEKYTKFMMGLSTFWAGTSFATYILAELTNDLYNEKRCNRGNVNQYCRNGYPIPQN